jgi:hypothetical protein
VGVADGQPDGLLRRPLTILPDLYEDLHRPGGEQSSVPPTGDPNSVEAPVTVHGGGRDLPIAAVGAGAQHKANAGCAVE